MERLTKQYAEVIVDAIKKDAAATDAFVQDVHTLLTGMSPSQLAPEQVELYRTILLKSKFYLGLT